MSATIEACRARFDADPGDGAAFSVLEEHLFREGEFDALVALYERRLAAPDVVGDPREAAPLLLRQGQVLEERCLDPEGARQRYEAALARAPRLRAALRQLRRMAAASGDFARMEALAVREAELPMRPFEKSQLHVDLGLARLGPLGDPAGALVEFDRALATEADPRDALAGKARALEALGRAEEAARIWERLVAELRGGPDRAPALVAWARLLGGPLDQPDRAVELYRRALTDDPRNADALEALAAAAASRGQWSLLADLQERRFEAASGASRRVVIASEAGRLALERLDDPQRARMWFARALELAADDLALHRAMADVERRLGDRTAVARRLGRLLDLAPEAATETEWLEAAALHVENGELDRAIERLRAALPRAENEAAVLERLADALSRAGRHDELPDLLERRAALAGDPAARAALFAELGALYETRLGDADAAREAFERAFAESPATPGVASALDRLYRKIEDWERLGRVLLAGLQASRGRDRVALLCSLGELRAERQNDPDGAAAAFEEALDGDPLCERALRGLERLALAGDDPDALLRTYEREAEVTTDPARLAVLVTELVRGLETRDRADEALLWAERLLAAAPENRSALETCARLHAQLGNEAELAEVVQRLEAQLAPAERAAMHREQAERHAAAGRDAEAIEAYHAALEVQASDLASLVALRPLLERTGRHAELARTLRRLVEVGPPADRIRHLDALARLLEGPLADPEGAVVVLWQLVQEPGAPEDADARLEALLAAGARFEELAQRLLERRHGLAPDSDEAEALDLQRAEVLAERLGQRDEAIEVLRETLRRRPRSRAAADALARLLREGGDAEALADLLAARAASESDPAARGRLELERARVLEERLGRPAEARSAYAALLEAADPSAVLEARTRLERLLEREGDWHGLRAHLEQGLAAADDDEAAFALRERLGRLCRDRLRDPAAGAEHLEAAARLRPGRAELWQSLALLYTEMDRHADLMRALEGELSSGPDPERERALRGRIATLCAGPLSNPERADREWARVLELDPGDATAFGHCAVSYEANGRTADLAALLTARLRALSSSADGETRIGLRLRLALLLAERLGDVDGAIAALEPALSEPGGESAVSTALAELYRRAGRAEAVVSLCRRAIAAATAPRERADWNLRLGTALAERGEDEGAIDALRRALADRPGDRDVENALCALHRRRGDAEPLVRLLEATLSRVGGAEELPLRVELATLLAGPLGRPADAFVHLRRALELDPVHPEALERALALAPSLGRTSDALAWIDAAASRTAAEPARAALALRRADLLAGPGRDPAAAVDAYREALRRDPSLAAARAGLRRALESLENWTELLETLNREAHAAPPAERAARVDEMAEIAWNRLGPEAALPWLERALAARPEDPRLLDRVAEVHRRAGRPDALLRTLATRLACTRDTEMRRTLHRERAALLEGPLASAARAADEIELALATESEEPTLLEALDGLCERAGRPERQAEVIEARIRLAPPGERAALQYRAARLLGDRLGRHARAAEHLEDALLEAGPAPAARAAALAALGEALRAAGRLERWAEVAEQELGLLDPAAPVFAERRHMLASELAEAYEGPLSRPAAALPHWRALADDALPGANGEAQDAARERAEERLLARLRAEHCDVELARRLAARLARRGDAAGWIELARLREERLHALAGAAEAYAAALACDDACREAMIGLRRVGERLGDFEEVARAIEREAALALPAPERATLLRRLGEIAWHRLGSTTRASRAFAAALEADPSDRSALHALQALLETMEDWPGAIALYESEIDMLGEADHERRRAVWLRIGHLAAERTRDLERAVASFEAAAGIGGLAADDRRVLADLLHRLGRRERYAEVLASICDDEAARPTPAEHLALALSLEAAGRGVEALARAERAVAADPRRAEAWDVAARLRQALGDLRGASVALEHAAALLPDAEAAERLVRAAELALGEEPERAADWLGEATRRDPARGEAWATLARVAASLGRTEIAQDAAERALALGELALDAALRLETSLVGGRSARTLGRTNAADRLFAAALALSPDESEALAARAELRHELGDLAAAAQAAERRLAQPGPNPRRARQLAIVAEARAQGGALDAARAAFEEALALDPSIESARAGLVGVHRAAGRRDDAIAALDAWAEASAGADRAVRLVEAAELAAEVGDDDGVELRLRFALEADPRHVRASRLLADRLWEAGREAEALDAAAAGLAALGDGQSPERAALARVKAHALEARGDRRGAAAAYGEAADADRDDCEAALAQGRLLRALGEWRAAADALRRFVRAASPGCQGLVGVQLQLARLLAGPLEDIDGAQDELRRALSRAPEACEIREALADLLEQRPSQWDEAVARHRELLAYEPTRLASLRALVRIARGRDAGALVQDGLAVLRALGAATPEERDAAPTRLALRLALEPALENVVWERARRLAQDAAAEIASALGASAETVTADGATAAGPAAAFRMAALRAEGELSAPALVPLAPAEAGAVISLVASLALGPDQVSGDGRLVNALASAVGRWSRRRLRKGLGETSPAEIAEIDFGAWRRELRSLAHAVAFDATGGDLRGALVALLGDEPDAETHALGEDTDLCGWVAASEAARGLLGRVIAAWSLRI